jgi:hypothetical protein
MTFIFTLAALAFPAPAPRADVQQPPIRIIFDSHVDPLPQGITLAEKQIIAQQSVDSADWILDQLDPIGGQLSFLAVGEFMEIIVGAGSGSPGDLLLQRIYASGGQIGSHSHSEIRSGAYDWPQLSGTTTYADAQQSWQDNVDWVNAAITLALGPSLPEPLADINCVKGAHLPQTESEFQTLMPAFGFQFRQGGPEEDYVQWYDHYIMHPYRPAAHNAMAEDLGGSFVCIPQCTTVGKAGSHHGIYQDMTAPYAKRRFLQTYLNWRHADRLGLPEKVWCFGWGSHPLDYRAGAPERVDLTEVLAWLDAGWIGASAATGSTIAEWSTQREVGTAYLAWEAAHPGVSSFSEDADEVDWDEYPWLRAVAEELFDTQWAAELALGSGVVAHHLTRGPVDVVVLWRDAGAATVDLSAMLNPVVRVVGAETGILYGTDPAAIPVGAEPVIVTEEAPVISVAGTPALGATLTVRVVGQPEALATVMLSTRTRSRTVPHLGEILIGPAPLITVGSGVIPGPAGLSLPLTIPADPAYSGRTAYLQGHLATLDGASAMLTVNAASFTVL